MPKILSPFFLGYLALHGLFTFYGVKGVGNLFEIPLASSIHMNICLR